MQQQQGLASVSSYKRLAILCWRRANLTLRPLFLGSNASSGFCTQKCTCKKNHGEGDAGTRQEQDPATVMVAWEGDTHLGGAAHV